tara:strand:+ start:1288 stop:1437 length:150 start_codon:yes stop_codon:yes gene_type:complete
MAENENQKNKWSVRTAVCLFPPAELLADIQPEREQHDKAYDVSTGNIEV